MPQIAVDACAHALVTLASERREDGESAWWACRDCGAQFAPIVRPREMPRGGPDGVPSTGTAYQEYVSIRELSRRIPYAEGSIRNLMSRGALKLGEHYVKPQGRVMFRWNAVRAWLETNERRGA